MKNRCSILLVSANPELHRILEIIASTYNFSFREAENARIGFGLLKSSRPNCVVFDLDILSNPRQRTLAKQKLEESGTSVLLLNDSNNGVQQKRTTPPPLRIEPIVQFIKTQHEKCTMANVGLFKRMLSLCGFSRA